MTEARIYQPTKTAMQSGHANTRRWVLEFEPSGRKDHDLLMGWVGSADTLGQVRVKFESKDEAIAFATKKGLDFKVHEPTRRRIRPKAYADNFRYQRPS
ncbi:MAG: ETC complex I subunit [Rhodospirillales bacterium]|jgi:hypothetical protein|nr:ETC complex I subunit [Rhodospirillales bacterium]